MVEAAKLGFAIAGLVAAVLMTGFLLVREDKETGDTQGVTQHSENGTDATTDYAKDYAQARREEMLSRGYVELEGRWVTPGRRDQILAEREEVRRQGEEEKRKEAAAREEERKRQVEKEREEAAAKAAERQRQERERRQREAQERAASTVTAYSLAKQYHDNEVAADGIFKDKWFYVEGKITSIGKDIVGTMYVALEGYSFRDVQCMFDDKYESQLANLRPGQAVTIRGTCRGLMMNVIMRDCVLK